MKKKLLPIHRFIFLYIPTTLLLLDFTPFAIKMREGYIPTQDRAFELYLRSRPSNCQIYKREIDPRGSSIPLFEIQNCDSIQHVWIKKTKYNAILTVDNKLLIGEN